MKTFAELKTYSLSLPPVTAAVAAGHDDKVLTSLWEGCRQGLISRAIVTGDKAILSQLITAQQYDEAFFDIRHGSNPQQVAQLACEAIHNGEADMLIKGAIDSVHYFKAILNKDCGIKSSPVLSNITVFEMPSYHKLLVITDNAMIPFPSLEEKVSIIENTRPLFKALQISSPKVAVVCAIEKVNPRITSTVDADSLKKMCIDGQLQGFLVDGPMGYDMAISREAATRKHADTLSPVAGDPDLLLLPNMEAANILGKAYKFQGQAQSGGVVLGASAPVVLNSRSDGADRRLNSMLIARALTHALTA